MNVFSLRSFSMAFSISFEQAMFSIKTILHKGICTVLGWIKYAYQILT